ncbi:hypothetical protein A2Z22_01485 [Candidatus Woesebacteria bacterium RBG_16_34_12]|uniref:Protein kinase domain-containing protein n=1 Tax=Candidatus Woesebacteria bacterium RBG_16_34_12 TaxID=1802480 RepID=A0A1F7XA30_9BACT|nr:MAG: hypothetical protein A2Z22_01485 [Candidatus Woesebacteria bacterium RBG_16_34_12]
MGLEYHIQIMSEILLKTESGNSEIFVKRIYLERGQNIKTHPLSIIMERARAQGVTYEDHHLLYPNEITVIGENMIEAQFPRMNQGNLLVYASKIPLEDGIKSIGGLPKEDLQRFIQQIGNAVDALHQLGFNHLDIKDDNILCHNGNFYLGDLDYCVERYSEGDQEDREMFVSLVAYSLVTAKAFAELENITDSNKEDEFFQTRLFEIVASEYSPKLRDIFAEFRSKDSKTNFTEFAKQVNEEINLNY